MGLLYFDKYLIIKIGLSIQTPEYLLILPLFFQLYLYTCIFRFPIVTVFLLCLNLGLRWGFGILVLIETSFLLYKLKFTLKLLRPSQTLKISVLVSFVTTLHKILSLLARKLGKKMSLSYFPIKLSSIVALRNTLEIFEQNFNYLYELFLYILKFIIFEIIVIFN